MVSSAGLFDPETSAMNESWYFWLMIGVNSFNIVLTASKVILIMVEVNVDDADELDVFKMAETVGPLNLELELYPDLAKIALMVINYGTFLAVPIIADEIAGGDKPVQHELPPPEDDKSDSGKSGKEGKDGKQAEPAPGPAVTKVLNDIKKNKSDDREYRFIMLRNQMKVILVHDKDVEMSAAYNIVSSGSLLDP